MSASGADRPASPDGSMHSRNDEPENMNLFADAFAVEEGMEDEEFDFVADGFRPGEGHDRDVHREDLLQFEDEEEDAGSSSANAASVAASLPQRLSRNSLRKGPRASMENPFASPDDPLLERTTSGTFAPGIAHRMSSLSSQATSRTRPSHAYAMYAQETPQSPGFAPTSSGRPSRQSTIRNGPQHPYALYPQGVDGDLEDEEDDDAIRNPVPLGFLGVGRQYRRRRGPDGEEQDIIGDYGHTEQLPPYTRYPEDAPEKMPLLEPPTPLHSRAPVMGSDPGMALMHTHLQPEMPPQQSMSDRSTLLDRNESRMSILPSSSADSRLDSIGSKKSWSEKSWKEKRKTRFLGIPLWLYLLALGTLSFIAVVLGGVIGGFVEGQEKSSHGRYGNNNPPAPEVYTTVTSLYDASFIPTPATATVPPSGTFKLLLGTPQATQSACLPDTSQRGAWSCDLAGGENLSIAVSSADSSNVSGAALFFPGGTPDTNLYYGSQASQMWTHYSPFIVVKDNDAPQNGYAYYLEHHFNKWVVVPSDEFDPDMRRFKRAAADDSASDNLSAGGAKMTNVGDRPWFCYWKGTLLEVFVYIQKPVHVVVQSSSVPTTNAASATPAVPMATPTSGSTAVSPTFTAETVTSPPLAPTSTSSLSTTLSFEMLTLTYTGPASAYSAWYTDNVPNAISNPRPTPNRRWDAAVAAELDALREKAAKPGASEVKETFLIEDVIGNGPMYFPYLIKIEERRLPGSPAPYCTQYQILENGSWNYAPNPNGSAIPWTIVLDEQDPPFSVYESQGIAGRDAKRSAAPGDSVPGACHCQWMSGQGQGNGSTYDG